MARNNRTRQTGTANAAVIQNAKQTSDTTPNTATEGKPPSESPSSVNQINSSSNTSPKKAYVLDEQEEESATTESMNVDEDEHSSSSSNLQEAGNGMADANNIPNSNRDSADRQSGPSNEHDIFEEAYNMDFEAGGERTILIQTGDGRAAVKGFNGAHHMNFENFTFSAAGSAPDTGPGVAMKHFGKAHDMKFKGVKLEFVGGKLVQTPISDANPQPRAAPNYQTQPYGYNQGYSQPPNMYPGPQANGWNNGLALQDGRGGGSPPLQITQSITAYASYEAQMPGNRQQPFYPEQGGQWYPPNQYAYAEQTMRPGQDAWQYGNPPPNMNGGPPHPWNQYRQVRR